MDNRCSLSFSVNGQHWQGEVEPRNTLADVLRDRVGLTGTHLGCEHGICGACTVLLNGHSARSCLTFAVQVQDMEVVTVEGIARGDVLHPIQQAFQEQHALQCGFCTPGFITTVYEFLNENPSPTEAEIREALSGNLCRCTGYVSIVKAVQSAAARLRAEHATKVA